MGAPGYGAAPAPYAAPATDDTKAELERLKKRVKELEKSQYQAPQPAPMMAPMGAPGGYGGMRRP
jgi:hypothetical protein